MNKPIRPDKPSDIDALFKAQNVEAPTDLDDFILAEARKAVDDSTGNVQRVVPGGRYRSWFAAAAAVLITAGIAPMLMQNPESALEPSSLASDSSSINAETFAQPMAIADAEQDSIQASDTAALAEQLTTESLTTAASAELQTASTRKSQRELAPTINAEETTMNAADESEVAVSENLAGGAVGNLLVYRRSPESWISEMQRLESENQMAEAHIEYDQFRKRYPRFETDYRPKDLPRNSPTDLPTD